MSRTAWHIIGRGFAGWHAVGVNVTSSGGSLDPYTYWTGQECPGYAAEAIDGALVYDASALENDDAGRTAYVHHVISGPMCDPSLDPDAVRPFSQEGRETLARMSGPGGLQGSYAALATIAQEETYGGLDQVGVAVYERLLRRVAGIRIGRVVGGVVQWEAG